LRRGLGLNQTAVNLMREPQSYSQDMPFFNSPRLPRTGHAQSHQWTSGTGPPLNFADNATQPTSGGLLETVVKCLTQWNFSAQRPHSIILDWANLIHLVA